MNENFQRNKADNYYGDLIPSVIMFRKRHQLASSYLPDKEVRNFH